MEKFYGPEEDTHLMIDALSIYFNIGTPKSTLEIGVGNGQVSKFLSSHCTNHIGVDINPHAIEETKRVCKTGNYFESNLFENIEGKFDLIVFNPPYLPEQKGEPDDWIKKAIVGGKKGYEIILKFLDEVEQYLTPDGSCLLLFSSLSTPKIILDKCNALLFSQNNLIENSIMGEQLFVYEINRSPLLNNLESNGYTDIKFFAKGTHGKVYTATKNNKTYSIKILNENNQAYDSIKNEANKLQIVNKVGVGPKFISYDETFPYVIYEFVDGVPWQKYFQKIPVDEVKEIILNIADQCAKLDEIGFEKKEMKRPNKNVLIENKLPVLIDFERGVESDSPGNITQFLQYLCNSKFASFIKAEGIEFDRSEIIELGLKYKKKEITSKEIKKYIQNVFEN